VPFPRKWMKAMRRPDRVQPDLPRRGFTRVEAAEIIGIGTDLFDRAVASGALPQPRVIGTRCLWDIVELNRAFDELPHRNASQNLNDAQSSVGTDFV